MTGKLYARYADARAKKSPLLKDCIKAWGIGGLICALGEGMRRVFLSFGADADTAGLCSLIGSLASVINYRIYVREYPDGGRKFIRTFTLVSWAFFAVVAVPGYLLTRWEFY